MKKSSLPIFLCLLLLASGAVLPDDKKQKDYPEQGKVVAFRVTTRSITLPVDTDSRGKTSGGMSILRRVYIYRIETETRIYELEGGRKPTLELNEAIRFRLEKTVAYVQRGKKEEKYIVVGAEQRPAKD